MIEPERPAPESKDWTWVLDTPCAFCGFDGDRIPTAGIAGTIAALTPRWHRVLDRAAVTTRPAPTVWSPLEYACHVRDVLDVFAGRAELIRTDDDARFADWDQNTAAVAGRYWEQDPARVAEDLAARAERVSALFATVPDGAWERRGLRSNGSMFTLGSLGRYLIHDVTHHLADVSG